MMVKLIRELIVLFVTFIKHAISNSMKNSWNAGEFVLENLRGTANNLLFYSCIFNDMFLTKPC